jgi:thymidylate kinase
MRRKMIVLFGLDGCGKSTQAELMREWLADRGMRAEVVWMRGESYLTRPVLALGKALLGAPREAKREEARHRDNRYGSYISAKQSLFKNRLLRGIWRTLALLDLWISVRVASRRLSRATAVVILDRYIYDTFVDIDSAFGGGGEEAVRLLESRLMRCFPRPDLVILLDLPPAQAMKRKEDIPSVEYLEERRGVYRSLAGRLGAATVDATNTIAEVAAAVRRAAEGVLT